MYWPIIIFNLHFLCCPAAILTYWPYFNCMQLLGLSRRKAEVMVTRTAGMQAALRRNFSHSPSLDLLAKCCQIFPVGVSGLLMDSDIFRYVNHDAISPFECDWITTLLQQTTLKTAVTLCFLVCFGLSVRRTACEVAVQSQPNPFSWAEIEHEPKDSRVFLWKLHHRTSSLVSNLKLC